MVSIRRFLTTLSFVIPVISLTPEANADPIIVGVTSNLAGFAVLAAQEKGFFAKNGVDVKIEIRNTGSEL
jgi:ABC-type nitrate/sulfonate/bicarbonate transport system substrate-binding protein